MTAADRSVTHNWTRTEGAPPMADQPSLAEALPPKAPSQAVARLSPKEVIRNTAKTNAPEILNALPSGYVGGADRFIRTVMTCVARDPNLLKCSPASIIGAAMQAAQLGLTPGVLGEAWLIPYGGECTFQLGYKGLVALASRAGISIQAHTVFEADQFSYELGLEPTLTHKPATGDRGKGVYWYAVARDRDAGRLLGFAVLDRQAVEKRRKANRGKSPAYTDWYDEMAMSKAVREVCRLLPLSVEMATAVATDGAVRTDITGQPDEYVPVPDDEYADGEIVE